MKQEYNKNPIYRVLYLFIGFYRFVRTVITHSAVFRALGREPRGNARIDQIPAFMDAKNLQSLISSDLRDMIKRVPYLDKNNKEKEAFYG